MPPVFIVFLFEGRVVKTPDEAFKAAQKIIESGSGNSFTDVVVKA